MSSTLHDVLVTFASLLAVLVLVIASRAFGRAKHLSASAMRKLLHAAVGALTLVATPFFHKLVWAMVPPILFGGVNASGKARALLPGMADTPEEARGLWTFPLGVALTYLVFWGDPGRASVLAGIAALAFADPAAAMVGARFGQRRLRGIGHGRTLEGSIAFFVVAAIAVGFVACAHGGGAFPWRMGIGCAIAGAVAEAATPSGWDNVTIPLAVAMAYRILG